VRYRTMTARTLTKASFDTIETTASVLFIVTAASIFAWLLTVSQAAAVFSNFIFALTDNKWVFLILVNILMLLVGCFLDTIAAITILVPILLPVATRYGVDPVHFGLIMTLNLMIGLLHPRSAWCSLFCRGLQNCLSSAPPWRFCPGWCRWCWHCY
jgi:TRAP-type C4-dicarboxylate transport system permease large subunit